MNDEMIVKSDTVFLSNIKVLFCGHQKCKALHSFGPGVHASYLLHIVLNGTGKYITGGKTYTLSKNDMFLITKDDVVFYQADEKNPWEYIWISLDGNDVLDFIEKCGISKDNPITKIKNPNQIVYYIYEMIRCIQVDYSQNLKLQGLMFQCLSSIVEQIPNKNETIKKQDNIYIEKAIEYIRYNYYEQINVTTIAEYLSLNRSYFSNQFKKFTGVSPSKYLFEFRILRAENLLKNTALTVYEIAKSCGFVDQSSFSKAFKRYYGLSPEKYKNKFSESKQ